MGIDYMYCPECGENTVRTEIVSKLEHYYSNNSWKITNHQCTKCLASFCNFNDGFKARSQRTEKENNEREEYERLKAKFENG